MSEQKGSFLHLKNSYQFNRQRTTDYKSRSIDPANFNSWQTTSMYKSSYADCHSKKSVEPKNKAIPGYGGYIPYINSENLHAKGYTPLTKDSFSSPKLGKNINGLSTNGFNTSK